MNILKSILVIPIPKTCTKSFDPSPLGENALGTSTISSKFTMTSTVSLPIQPLAPNKEGEYVVVMKGVAVTSRQVGQSTVSSGSQNNIPGSIGSASKTAAPPISINVSPYPLISGKSITITELIIWSVPEPLVTVKVTSNTPALSKQMFVGFCAVDVEGSAPWKDQDHEVGSPVDKSVNEIQSPLQTTIVSTANAAVGPKD